MNPSVRPIATLIACLSLVACRQSSSEDGSSDSTATPPEISSVPEAATAQDDPSSSEKPKSPEQEITDLKRKIQIHEQTIEDLGAAVLMERAKLEENPDYDQSFLNDVLNEQEQERLEIEKAQNQLEPLTR